MFKLGLTLVFVLLGLSGCTGMRLVDTNVRSYATPPLIAAGALYRFERLPSQQIDAVQQNQLEALVKPALAQVGLRYDEAAALYSVQASVSTKVDPYSPWDHPAQGGMSWNFGFGLHSGNLMMGQGLFGMAERPYYWRQVSLIIRNLNTQQVVYETHAANDGPWSDSTKILPALFEAALKNFPNPPPGERRINLEIPR